jgi:multidrug resistance efflux pump
VKGRPIPIAAWRLSAPRPGAIFAETETQAVSLFQIRAVGVPGMKHQHHFGSTNVIVLRDVARLGAFIGDLDRRAQLLDKDIAAEEERARVFNPFDAAYPVLARAWAARRDNLKATVATLEKRLASLQKRADKVPA